MGLIYCANCKQTVPEEKKFSWVAFLILLIFTGGIGGILYLLYYYGVKKGVCPICKGGVQPTTDWVSEIMDWVSVVINWLSRHRIFGFRSKTPWKMCIAILGYFFLVSFVVTNPLLAAFFAVVVMLFLAVAIYINFLGIRSRMLEIPVVRKIPGIRSGKKGDMAATVICFALALLIVTIFMIPTPAPLAYEERAIEIVKNYRVESHLISIEEYFDMALEAVEGTGYYSVSDIRWSAEHITGDVYLVTYSYNETVVRVPPIHPEYQVGDVIQSKVVFRVNIKTGEVSGEDSVTRSILDTIKMIQRP